MVSCVYCHKAKGKRSCPALGGLICPRCCGEHRQVRIACPPDCAYLTTHEGYQRGRTAQAFSVERARVFQGLKNQKMIPFLAVMEAVIFKYFAQRGSATDAEVIVGLEDLRRRLSPLALPESARSPFGDALWKEMEAVAKESGPQAAVEAMDAYLKLARSFSDSLLRSRQFLRGLLGLIEQIHPELAEQFRKEAAPGRILLP
ncbi:MAG TPA: hypothetical protein VMN77_12590 [Nitrospiria bacterium]|jgi:hypothetical protein|nr:hypothetical protein [Nitrospiria bacterium]